MTTLYSLTNEYSFLEQTIGAEADESLQQMLDSLMVAIGDKVENIGKFVLSLKADTASIKAEEERLTLRRKAIENRIEWLKVYLLEEMVKVGKDRIAGKIVTVLVKTDPPSVNIIDENALPGLFRRVIPETWQPDKIGIIDHFKNTGEIVPGTEIIANKKSVTIK